MNKHTPGPWSLDLQVLHKNADLSQPFTEPCYYELKVGPGYYDREEGRGGALVGYLSDDDADFLRTAIHCHDELVDALKGLFELIERGDLVRDITRDGDPDWAIKMFDFVPRLQKAQAAIAKATGGEE